MAHRWYPRHNSLRLVDHRQFSNRLGIGAAEILTKMTLYYLHERLWYQSRFGLGKSS